MAAIHKKKLVYLFIIFVLFINLLTPFSTEAAELSLESNESTLNLTTDDIEQITSDSATIEDKKPFTIVEDFENNDNWKATGAKLN